MKPNEKVRKLIREFMPADANQSDAEVKAHFEKLYREMLKVTVKNQTYYSSLLILCAWLLSYGELSVVGILLKSLVPPREAPEALVNGVGEIAIRLLFPIPENLRLRHDIDGTEKWFNENLAKLRWDESIGRFVLL